MTEDVYFTFNADYAGETVHVDKTVGSDDGLQLTAILAAFKDFIRRAGFEYVNEVVAYCGAVDHSSEDYEAE